MRKTVVAVFAHPDDEALGPAGTLAKFSKTHDIHLLCVTDGQAGKNSLKNTARELSKIRKQELFESAKILGIKKIHCLGFVDGTLSNNLYHEVAKKIKKKLLQLKPEFVITFEPHGISGHIDHIAVTFITTYVVKQLLFIKNLYYYCLTLKEREMMPENYFVYFPDGYKKNEIDWEVDITDVWDTKLKAMNAHASQKHDTKTVQKAFKNLPKKEYFLKFQR